MILKRVEKDNKVKAIYSSSNILASTYDKTDNSLTLIFNKGAQYKYPGVSLTDYTRFELAESQGVVLNSHIKKYPFEKLEVIDPAEIVKEINTIKESESKMMLEAKQTKLVKTMIELTANSVTNDGKINLLTEEELAKLQSDLTNLITEISKTKTTVA